MGGGGWKSSDAAYVVFAWWSSSAGPARGTGAVGSGLDDVAGFGSLLSGGCGVELLFVSWWLVGCGSAVASGSVLHSDMGVGGCGSTSSGASGWSSAVEVGEPAFAGPGVNGFWCPVELLCGLCSVWRGSRGRFGSGVAISGGCWGRCVGCRRGVAAAGLLRGVVGWSFAGCSIFTYEGGASSVRILV